MTLATRCAACGTAFRVVEDQLKVSDGWVRCGSCNGVFNASENLFRLPQDARSAAVDPTAGMGDFDGNEVGQQSVVDVAPNDSLVALRQGLTVPESHVEPKPEPGAEPEPEAERTAEAEAEAEAKPEPEPEQVPQPETEAKAAPAPQPMPQHAAELESQSKPPPEPVPEAPPESYSAPESEFEAEPPAQAGPTSRPEVKPEPVIPEAEHVVGDDTESAQPRNEDRAPEAMVGLAPVDAPQTGEGTGASALGDAWREASPALRDAAAHPSSSESTDTAFESTVAITGSSDLPASGFGASQPHSAFRDSDAPPDSRIDAHLFKPRRRPATKTLSERDRPDFSDARFDSDLMAYEEDAAVADAPREASLVDPSAPEPHPAPGFLREAERSALWQRPRMRIALSLVAAVLAIVGVLQIAHHFRDAAAVRWPSLRPVLAQWCGMAGCTIEPLRRIEAISIEGTGLVKAPGTEAFRLTVGLRNRGSVPVALPWIELTVTDGAGNRVARKALAAAEFKPPSPLLQPGADVVLQTLLGARGLQMTGYTVEVFYP